MTPSFPSGPNTRTPAGNSRKVGSPTVGKKNAKLRRKLQKRYERSGGTSIPFEHKPLEELFAMIAKALAWQHWARGASRGRVFRGIAIEFSPTRAKTSLRQMLFPAGKRLTFLERFWAKARSRMRARKGLEYPGLTLWRFEIYGGVQTVRRRPKCVRPIFRVLRHRGHSAFGNNRKSPLQQFLEGS